MPRFLTLLLVFLGFIWSETAARALNLSNSPLALSGNCSMQINASTNASSTIGNISTVTYGGTLTVGNLAGAFSAGETFTLFSAGNYHGTFSNITLPALPVTLQWNTANLAVNGTISVAQSPWGQWLSQNFTAMQLADATVSGATAAPNGDGIPNLLKYALGLDVWSCSPLPMAYDIEAIGGSRYLQLTVYKNPSATDLAYTIEGSADLSGSDWTTADTTVELNTSSTLTVRDNIPMSSASKGFLRLNVTQP